MDKSIRIGNAGGFWGDSLDAAATLVRQQPDIDYLTLDYLAEVSMSILARQRRRDPSRGFAADVLEVVKSLAPFWVNASRTGGLLRPRVVTNAGGLNPHGCAEACARVLRDEGVLGLRIGVVSGDDVLAKLRASGSDGSSRSRFENLETGAPLDTVRDRLVTANAYLGAEPIVTALSRGADLVITGRVADPSLTVGPCAATFGWSKDDYNRLAGATVAGHLIECGTQVTGGISTDWLTVPEPAAIGFPIAELSDIGECVITKPPHTGGRVDERTVKEQLLYEIGDPECYLSPDATVSFGSLSVQDLGRDRVQVRGANGRPPPATYKVSATYEAGFCASGMLSLFGRDCVAKARRCGEVVGERLRRAGCEPQRWRVECLGAGEVVPMDAFQRETMETVLRISVGDERREVVEHFAKELMPLITAGPQGLTGYAEGRPRVHEVFGYWPCCIERRAVQARVEWIEV